MARAEAGQSERAVTRPFAPRSPTGSGHTGRAQSGHPVTPTCRHPNRRARPWARQVSRFAEPAAAAPAPRPRSSPCERDGQRNRGRVRDEHTGSRTACRRANPESHRPRAAPRCRTPRVIGCARRKRPFSDGIADALTENGFVHRGKSPFVADAHGGALVTRSERRSRARCRRARRQARRPGTPNGRRGRRTTSRDDSRGSITRQGAGRPES